MLRELEDYFTDPASKIVTNKDVVDGALYYAISTRKIDLVNKVIKDLRNIYVNARVDMQLLASLVVEYYKGETLEILKALTEGEVMLVKTSNLEIVKTMPSAQKKPAMVLEELKEDDSLEESHESLRVNELPDGENSTDKNSSPVRRSNSLEFEKSTLPPIQTFE